MVYNKGNIQEATHIIYPKGQPTIPRTPDNTDWGTILTPTDLDELNEFIEDKISPKLRIARLNESGRTPRWAVYIRGDRNPRIKRAQIQDCLAWILFAKALKINPLNPLKTKSTSPTTAKSKPEDQTVNLNDPRVQELLKSLMNN